MNTQIKKWLAPAKLNLFLHITGVRRDGYHNLQSIFQLIDFNDELIFNQRKDREWIRHYSTDAISRQSDLVLKSAQSLLDYANEQHLLDTDFQYGLDIYLDKHIPMGGGLGGGSSDAATTLVALNELWDLHLDKQILMSIGQKIGADVPIFIYGQNAWAEGIGEKLSPIDLDNHWFVIVAPDEHVSTQLLFQHNQLNRSSPMIDFKEFVEGNYSGDLINAFEALVINHYPKIKKAYQEFSSLADVKMTGTGACLFCLCATEQEARQIQSQLLKSYNAYCVKGLSSSPLYR